jgi:hypothetical protein
MCNNLTATMAELAGCKAELAGCKAELDDYQDQLQTKTNMCGVYYDSYVNSSTMVVEVGGVLRDATLTANPREG